MIIDKKDTGTSVLYTAKQGNFSTTQLYSASIPEYKRDSHFQIEASILYEKWIDNGKSELQAS